MRTEPVIVLNNLTRRFGDVVAVDCLSLEVYPGEVFGFLGHNGAGKRPPFACSIVYSLRMAARLASRALSR